MKNNWKPVIQSFIFSMIKAGFRPSVTDNGDGDVSTPTIQAMVEEINATDESHAVFTKDGAKYCAFIVLGNSPHELVCDYTYRESEGAKQFDSAIIAWSESWEGKDCPTVED